MRVYAEMVDRAGAVLLRLEGEADTDSDLTALVAAVNQHFRAIFPQRAQRSEGKAGYMIRIGAAPPTIWH